MHQMRHQRSTLPATRGGTRFDGEELSSAYVWEFGFMFVLRTLLMRILILLVTVLRVAVFVLSDRAELAKSKGKAMEQSCGTYHAWGFEEDPSQNYSSSCTSRWTWAREARSSRLRRMIALAGVAWRLC